MDTTPQPPPLNANMLETKPNSTESNVEEKCVLELQQSDRELRDFIEHAAVAMHWVAGETVRSFGPTRLS
jgi:hypothetical protein